tara:strand:+ start:357 stop:530 length:174 start_codon:yes stop_codon:yes gene_type:complete
MTRRIKLQLKEFFEKRPLSDKEKQFIVGCLKAQIRYPQLTTAQWRIVKKIEKKYKDK